GLLGDLLRRQMFLRAFLRTRLLHRLFPGGPSFGSLLLCRRLLRSPLRSLLLGHWHLLARTLGGTWGTASLPIGWVSGNQLLRSGLLISDVELWGDCERRGGQGPGYRDAVSKM